MVVSNFKALAVVADQLLYIMIHMKCQAFFYHQERCVKYLSSAFVIDALALKVPIPTKVVWFSGLLKCIRSLYDKQYGPR